MLTKVEVSAIDFHIKLATLVPVIPLGWNTELGELTIPKSKSKYYILLIHYIISLCYFAFVICRFIPGFPYDYKNLESNMIFPLTFHLYLTLREVILNVGQYFLLKNAHEYCAWFQRLRIFRVNYGMEKLRKQYANPTRKDTYLKYFEWFAYVPALISCFVFPIFRENPNFIFSVISEEWRTWWMLSIFTIYETHVVIRTATICYIGCVFTYVQVYSVYFWIKQCRKWVAVPNLTDVFKTIKMLEIFIKAWETQSLIEIYKVEMEVGIVASAYLGIRLHKFLGPLLLGMPVLVTIAFFFIDAVFTTSMANIYEKSVQLKSELDSALVTLESSERAYTSRMIRSYRPARIQNPVLYYERNVKLLTLEMLLTAINYMLVTF